MKCATGSVQARVKGAWLHAVPAIHSSNVYRFIQNGKKTNAYFVSIPQSKQCEFCS
jgi:hypothetical protein